jgi:hypothetical protein
MTWSEGERKRVLRSLLIAAPGEGVWEVLGDFRRPEAWLPGIEHVEITETIPGRIQRLCATVLGDFRESLIDSGTQWQVYTIDRSPLFVTDYRALLAVKSLDANSCGLLWAASFLVSSTADPALGDAIVRIFDTGVSRICKMFPAESDSADRWRHWNFPLDRIGWRQ